MIGFMSTSLKVVNMAVSFLTPTRRSATLRRSMLIFSRLTSRLPVQPAPGRSGWGMPFAMAARTSCLSTRPPGPLPATWPACNPFSSISLRAAGEGCPAAWPGAAGAGAGAAAEAGAGSGFAGAGAGAAAGGAASAGASASVSIRQTTAPTATASPSSALSVMVPAISAGSSRVALSLSTSAMAWSLKT